METRDIKTGSNVVRLRVDDVQGIIDAMQKLHDEGKLAAIVGVTIPKAFNEPILVWNGVTDDQKSVLQTIGALHVIANFLERGGGSK